MTPRKEDLEGETHAANPFEAHGGAFEVAIDESASGNVGMSNLFDASSLAAGLTITHSTNPFG